MNKLLITLIDLEYGRGMYKWRSEGRKITKFASLPGVLAFLGNVSSGNEEIVDFLKVI